MPEQLPPGVYVEQVSNHPRAIEGVSTSTAGFVGPTSYGPLDTEPQLITSLAAFELSHGGGSPLEFASGAIDNYVWHAVRAFFQEGGQRLYVSRVFKPVEGGDGLARCSVDGDTTGTRGGGLRVCARHPGTAGNCKVTLTLELGPNKIFDTPSGPHLPGVSDRDVVLVDLGNPAPHQRVEFCLALRDPLIDLLTFRPLTMGSDLTTADLMSRLSKVQALTASVRVESSTGGTPPYVVSGLPIDPRHRSDGRPDSLLGIFGEPVYPIGGQETPVVLSIEDINARDPADGVDGLDVLRALTDAGAGSHPRISLDMLMKPGSEQSEHSLEFLLSGGNDGDVPGPEEYAGSTNLGGLSRGLKAFEGIRDISVVAAPGASLRGDAGAIEVIGDLISHAEEMRHRIAILDSGKNQSISDVLSLRARFDSSHAAIYYPWVTIIDPLTGAESDQPPSGSVAGIYARNDMERAIYKAPSNEVVRLAVGFEMLLSKSEQEVLNPEGVNCFRFFEGRGMRLWGARTMSSNPEFKYVNVRRYLAYLERSLEEGLRWVVFESSDERLWANVRSRITDFLHTEWRNGGLLGDKPEKAFFVKCDRSTISQDDLDSGRLTCSVGVAVLRPAEFLVLRLDLQTAVG